MVICKCIFVSCILRDFYDYEVRLSKNYSIIHFFVVEKIEFKPVLNDF